VRDLVAVAAGVTVTVEEGENVVEEVGVSE